MRTAIITLCWQHLWLCRSRHTLVSIPDESSRAQGIKFHAEHIMMGVAIAVVLAQFIMIAREYIKGNLESLPIIILTCASLLAICIAGACVHIPSSYTWSLHMVSAHGLCTCSLDMLFAIPI